MGKKNNIFNIIIFLLLIFFLVSCENGSPSENDYNGNNNKDDTSLFGVNEFLPDPKAEFQVIFFDNDNIVSKDGKSFERNIDDDGYSNNKPSDIYLIKSGNVEILVDGGTQESQLAIKATFKKNIAKKLAAYITDGILEYLIITHSDYDHIAYLYSEGGLFDMFLNNSGPETDIYGNTYVGFKKIETIIDFDSFRVRTQSDIELIKEKRLIKSDAYQTYVTKRDLLINKYNIKYYPASIFFHTKMEVKASRMPYIEVSSGLTKDNLINDWDLWLSTSPRSHYFYGVANTYLNNFNTFSNIYYLYNTRYISSANNKQYNSTAEFINGNTDYQIGELKTYKVQDNSERYTYDIEINNGVYLKILYNWNHDNFRQHGFDGQDINDLSVPFIVESKSGKFLSTGDGSGLLEESLLKYYTGTNVLKNITLFKAAHHGSVSNKENSKELYDNINPEIIVITGTIQPTREHLDETDSLYSKLMGVTTLKQEFFNNINNPNAKILVNKIVYTTNQTDFQSGPLYGDIKIVFKNNNHYIHYNYIGKVKAYINKKTSNIEFETYKKNNQLYLFDIEWFKILEYERPKGN